MKNKIAYLHKSKCRRAQSLVEFTVSLLLILTVLVGAVELSLALFEYITIRDAAQEGALFGSVNPRDIDGIRNRVIDSANDGVALTAGNIAITSNGNYCEGENSMGVATTITIRITHPHKVIMPLAGVFLGQQINMTATATNTILTPTCPP